MTSDDTVTTIGFGRKSAGELCDTPTTDALGLVLQMCQMEGELGIITGEPGAGKTSAARLYAAQAPGCYMVTASPATSALVSCLELIGTGLECYPHRGTGGASWTKAIQARFRQEADAPLLLIDEAHHLSDDAVEEVRAIFDASRDLGVVFIGSRELRERWSGRRWAQLTSRVYQRLDLSGPMPGDIDAICMAAGIGEKRTRDLLRKAGAKPGGLRVVRKLLSVAGKLAGPDNPIKLEHIQAACQNRGELGA